MMPVASAFAVSLLVAAGAREARLPSRAEARAPDAGLAPARRAAAPQRAAPGVDPAAWRRRQVVEVEVEARRLEQLRDLEQIIALGGDPAELPALLFHLAELDAEEAHYLAGQAERGVATAAERARGYGQQAVQRYRDVLARAPDFARADEVLYYLADTQRALGDDPGAIATLERLVKDLPQSPLAPDAWLAIGERRFDGGDVKEALQAYLRAAERTGTGVYGYALYKQAWCRYNLREHPKAGELFRAVILYGLATYGRDATGAEPAAKSPRLALVAEARKDYVLNFSQYRDASEAEEDFRSLGDAGDASWRMLVGLADLYFGTGRDRDAVVVYRRLITARPSSPDAPLFQAKLVDAAARLGDRREAIREGARLVELLASAAQGPAVEEARKLGEQTLRGLAVQYHNEAKKTGDAQTWDAAEALYADDLEAFPDASGAYDLHFYFGELLYKRGKFAAAAAQYRAAVELDRARAAKGKWLAEAAYDWVLAADEVAHAAHGDADAGLVDACEGYLAALPAGPHAVEIGYKVAQLHAKAGRYPRAVALFSDVALKHPDSDLAEYAANLALDALNLEKDYAALNEMARAFAASPALMARGTLRADVYNVEQESAFKLVELESEPRKAAEAYVAFVAEFPRSPLADRALFDAAAMHAKRGARDAAMAMRDRLAREYPQSPLVPASLLENARDHALLADYAEAARYGETYAGGFVKEAAERAPKPALARRGRRGARAAKPPPPPPTPALYDSKKALAALFDAAVFREALGDAREALTDRQLLLDTWPDAPEAKDVAHSLAGLAEALGDARGAAERLDAWAKKYAGGADETLAALLEKARLVERTHGGARAVDAAYAAVVDRYQALGGKERAKVTPAGLAAVAAAKEREVENARARLDGVKLAPPLDRAVERKAAALAEVQRLASGVVALGAGGPAVCALAELGGAYDRFATALWETPTPAGLTDAQQKLYRDALGQKVTALRSKGADALGSARTKAAELGLAPPCLAKLASKTSELTVAIGASGDVGAPALLMENEVLR